MNRLQKIILIVLGIVIIIAAGTIFYVYKSWVHKNAEKGLLDFNSINGKQLELVLEPDINNFLLENCNNNSQTRIKSVIETLSTDETKKITLLNFVAQYQTQYQGQALFADFDSVLANYNFAHSNNEETMIALSRLIDEYLVKSLAIIRKRMAKTDLENPSIHLNKSKQRIELKVDHVIRIHELTQFISNQANLNFFETYSQEEVNQKIIDADSVLAMKLSPVQKREVKKPIKAKANSDTISMEEIIEQNDANREINHSETNAEIEKQRHPIRFYLLGGFETRKMDGQVIHDARISFVRMSDTAVLNKYLNDDLVKKMLPSDLVFMYGPAQDDMRKQHLDLLILHAIRVSGNVLRPVINGRHLIHVEKGKDPITDNSNIQLEMDQYGSQVWEQMTRKNINRPIAIAIDNLVLSAPAPTEAITGGRSCITGAFSEKEIDQLISLLQWGALPIKLNVQQETAN